MLASLLIGTPWQSDRRFHHYPCHAVLRLRSRTQSRRRMLEVRTLSIDDFAQVRALADQSEREGFRFVNRFNQEMHTEVLDSPEQFFLGIFEEGQLRAIGRHPRPVR